MAQSLACVVSGGALKLEGAANARVLTGKASTSAAAVAVRRRNVVVCASSSRSSSSSSNEEEAETSSRRSVLSLLAATVAAGAFVQNASALVDIPLAGAPPLSGGLPGTENADEARDTDLDLVKRFYFQTLPSSAAAGRVKEAADEIIGVKSYIDKKAWPYVMNDLRSKASYLGFDLKTIIDSKPKAEKKELVALKTQLFDCLNKLDYAAKTKSTPKAEKAYAETVELLKKVVASIA